MPLSSDAGDSLLSHCGPTFLSSGAPLARYPPSWSLLLGSGSPTPLPIFVEVLPCGVCELGGAQVSLIASSESRVCLQGLGTCPLFRAFRSLWLPAPEAKEGTTVKATQRWDVVPSPPYLFHLFISQGPLPNPQSPNVLCDLRHEADTADVTKSILSLLGTQLGFVSQPSLPCSCVLGNEFWPVAMRRRGPFQT